MVAVLKQHLSRPWTCNALYIRIKITKSYLSRKNNDRFECQIHLLLINRRHGSFYRISAPFFTSMLIARKKIILTKSVSCLSSACVQKWIFAAVGSWCHCFATRDDHIPRKQEFSFSMLHWSLVFVCYSGTILGALSYFYNLEFLIIFMYPNLYYFIICRKCYRTDLNFGNWKKEIPLQMLTILT